MKKLIAIDGNSLMHRAYHALPPMTTRAGVPTGALHGFISMLLKLIERNPDYLVVAFDMHGPTFRHEQFEAYKAGRKETEDDLKTQFPLLKYVMVAFGDKVGFATTLDEALDQVFEGDSGADAGDAGIDPDVEVEPVDPGTTPTPEPTEPTEPTDGETSGSTTPTLPAVPGTPAERLSVALDEAKTAMDASRQAQVDGDWAAYGEAQEALNAALEQAIAAQNEIEAAG